MHPSASWKYLWSNRVEKDIFLNYFINKRIHNAIKTQTKNKDYFIVLCKCKSTYDIREGKNLADVVQSISQKLQICCLKKLIIKDELNKSLDSLSHVSFTRQGRVVEMYVCLFLVVLSCRLLCKCLYRWLVYQSDYSNKKVPTFSQITQN